MTESYGTGRDGAEINDGVEARELVPALVRVRRASTDATNADHATADSHSREIPRRWSVY